MPIPCYSHASNRMFCYHTARPTRYWILRGTRQPPFIRTGAKSQSVPGLRVQYRYAGSTTVANGSMRLPCLHGFHAEYCYSTVVFSCPSGALVLIVPSQAKHFLPLSRLLTEPFLHTLPAMRRAHFRPWHLAHLSRPQLLRPLASYGSSETRNMT